MAKLTDKQLRFVEEYPVDLNATRAAIRAKYSEDTAAAIGYENLQKPHIRAAIDERLRALSMSTEEALKRLADMARGTLHPFIKADEQGRVWFNLASEEAQANLHLIKKVKSKRTVHNDDRGEWEEDWIEIELHDSKDAIDKILRAHGAYKDRLDLTSGDEPITEVNVSIRTHNGGS